VYSGMTDVSLTRLNRGSLDKVNETLLPIDKTGLVAYYPFWQNSGTTLYDESKTGNDGTISGATWTWVTARSKPALDFDGVDDYVSVPDDSSLNPTDEITISHWIKTTAGSWAVSLRKNNQYWLQQRTDGTARGDLYIEGTDYTVGANAHTLNDGNWHLQTLTYDGSQLKLYVDGEFDDSNNISGTIDTTTNNLIFSYSSGLTARWPGVLDEVLIYNRALSASEIANIYEKTRP